MNNNRDKSALKQQISLLRNHQTKVHEYLSAIELLVVDDNNSRVKDPQFKNELQQLTSKVSAVTAEIDKFYSLLG